MIRLTIILLTKEEQIRDYEIESLNDKGMDNRSAEERYNYDSNWYTTRDTKTSTIYVKLEDITLVEDLSNGYCCIYHEITGKKYCVHMTADDFIKEYKISVSD